ncbi:DUF2083 domain-containing protein, partial [Corallococcus exiguus]|nr:DUF2083 domain-containing protein [Corallococcus exiguus]
VELPDGSRWFSAARAVSRASTPWGMPDRQFAVGLGCELKYAHRLVYARGLDLAAPDPTTVFNLFGLIPFDPGTVPVIGHFLLLGAWPIIMGITMWLQMKMNPAPPDPVQQKVFAWMPVIFTFMLGSFPAGLVIYWAWNNLLSVIQQGFIMKRN